MVKPTLDTTYINDPGGNAPSLLHKITFLPGIRMQKKTDLYYRNEYIAAKLLYRIFFIPEATCLIPLNGALMS